MIDVIETNEKIILVCNYKNEINLIDDILGGRISGAQIQTK